MDTSTVVQRADTLGRRVVPRRFRSVEDKLMIVAEARASGSVASVARKHGVNANLVFAWMRLDAQGLLRVRSRGASPRLLAVSVAPDPPPTPQPSQLPGEPGYVEIALSDGISVRIFGAVPSERIEQVLRLLRR